jgi:hypothetical protein
MAQLEALALGAVLVSTATDGPFEALAIARELAPELVTADRSPHALAESISRAFALGKEQVGRYRAAASVRIAPYLPDAVARTIADQVLPVLLSR